MNRLRIVVEETGPGAYVVVYVGRDAGKAQEALREPTPNYRALYNYPKASKYNRRTIAGAPENLPPEGETDTAVDEAADLVGGATESPGAIEAAPENEVTQAKAKGKKPAAKAKGK
jgi:hypothetical protein